MGPHTAASAGGLPGVGIMASEGSSSRCAQLTLATMTDSNLMRGDERTKQQPYLHLFYGAWLHCRSCAASVVRLFVRFCVSLSRSSKHLHPADRMATAGWGRGEGRHQPTFYLSTLARGTPSKPSPRCRPNYETELLFPYPFEPAPEERMFKDKLYYRVSLQKVRVCNKRCDARTIQLDGCRSYKRTFAISWCSSETLVFELIPSLKLSFVCTLFPSNTKA